MENVILIGMPASGKSTAGRLLARKLGFSFCDGDDLLRAGERKPLSEIIEERGNEGFLRLESDVLCGLSLSRCVLATGGSAVYSAEAMEHLRSLGKVVYLKLCEREITRRIPDFSARGVVMRGSVSDLGALYRQRVPLYEHYADLTVDCDDLTVEETVGAVLSAIQENV